MLIVLMLSSPSQHTADTDDQARIRRHILCCSPSTEDLDLPSTSPSTSQGWPHVHGRIMLKKDHASLCVQQAAVPV